MKTFNNKVQLLGYVGRDPEIRILDSGRKLVRFPLATNHHYTNALGERVERTYWHSIVFWNRAADFVERLVRVGSRVAVEGQLTYRSWEDEDGNLHYRTEIAGREFYLI